MQKKNNPEKSCSACATDIFEEKEPLWKQKKVMIMLAAGIILAIGLYFEFLTKQHLAAQTLFFVVVIIAGYNIIKKGFLSLLKKTIRYEFLNNYCISRSLFDRPW